MTSERRNRLQKVIDLLEELRDDVASICDEERDSYDNMPESLQGGERGLQMENNISTLEDQDDIFQ